MTTLLCCAGGGHLRQLHRLLPRLPVESDVVWMTFDTGLSRSLLAGAEVIDARYPEPHDIVTTLRNGRLAAGELRRRNITSVFSTGSGIALSVLPLARARGAACHYIESATRTVGPSATGRVLQLVPGVNLYTQYERWSGGRWAYGGSVFDGFETKAASTEAIERVVVTLGTTESYGFPRLVRRLLEVIPEGAQVLWQTGSTEVDGLGIDARHSLPSAELSAAMRDADVVIAHAGTGSAIEALEAGKVPVLVPRRRVHGEHVDDHQQDICNELVSRGLAISCDADELTTDHLHAASAQRVTAVEEPPPFRLTHG